MKETKTEAPRLAGQLQEGSASSPTVHQLRTVGQRRREAEEKLEHHIEAARHKHDLHGAPVSPMESGTGR